MVFEAKLLGTEERVALKKISKKTVALEDFTREMATLKTIHEAGGISVFKITHSVHSCIMQQYFIVL
jgi:hypothetical protein